jgi:outer membrane receptor protein involved in Fe transport
VAQQATGNASQSSQSGGTDDLAQVLVTGSRVATNGASAPTPVTVVSADQLQAAAPTSLVDALNQLPQMLNSSTPASNNGSTTGTVGQTFLNLRSLGANRTLILLDGSRLVPSSLLATTDVSLIPESLVQRVDVVTGGASAVYGSDAVAGVVNFVLDTKFTGFSTRVQAGESGYEDARNGKVAITAGTSLFGDRGHLVFSADAYKNNGVEQFGSRDWFDSCALIGNPAGTPTYIPACAVRSAQFNFGGMISSGPLKGTYFAPGGVPRQFQYGTQVTSTTMVGGQPIGSGYPDVGANFTAVPEVDRKKAFAHFEYEINDQFTAYAQALAAEGRASFNQTRYPWQGQSSAFQIQIDNAYLPATIRDRMVAAGITTFSLSRQDKDWGPIAVDTANRTQEYKVGLHGKVSDWKLDVYAQHGENSFLETTLHNAVSSNVYNAADAVLNPATGQVVCRSTLTQPGNGCVPLNVFGEGAATPDAVAYATATSWSRIRTTEDVAEASVSGAPFATWAGPVTTAFGAGYRKESAAQISDPISSGFKHFTGGYKGFPAALEGVFGGFDRGNAQPVSGSYNLYELFAETLVPLAGDKAWARSLDFNAAVRETHYSTSGSVTSWKGGLTWQAIDSLRLRVARSRDIRAPNVNELYSAKSQAQSSLLDPFQPAGSAVRFPIVYTVTSGNTDLKNESADTTTVGLVLTPSWAPRLTVSVDGYNIRIKDAITTLGGQTTINQCFQGSTALCGLLTRGPDGQLTAVSTPYLNIGSSSTRGVDFESDYVLPLSSLISSAGGDLTIRALANFTDRFTQVLPGAPDLELAGQTGASPGVPKWQGTLSMQYRGGPYSVYAQERYIGHGALHRDYDASTLDPMYNYVASVMYTDLTMTYDFDATSAKWSTYFTVNNLFDRGPPRAPSTYFVFGTSAGGTNLSLFDIVGRTYTLGFKLNF